MKEWDMCAMVNDPIKISVQWLYVSTLLDIDECLDDPCDSNATCTNTAGSYTCECNIGFTGSGHNCTSMLAPSLFLQKLTVCICRY